MPATTPAAGVIWSDAPEFSRNIMPTSLAGIQVTINGKPAYIYFYCSAATSTVCQQDQINVLAPAADTAVGPVDVIVINNGAATAPFSVNQRAISPTLLQFDAAGHVTSIHADGSLLGPTSLYPGLSTPARPLEVITVFGVGFGTGASILEGSSAQTSSLGPLTCTVGGVSATVPFAGIVSPGLAQINLTVPALAAGEHPISCAYAGTATSSAAKLAVQP